MDDETVPSTHMTDGNGCSEVNNDLDAKLESAELHKEGAIDDTVASDEQPLKKQKSVISEYCSPPEANNGGLALISIVHLFI